MMRALSPSMTHYTTTAQALAQAPSAQQYRNISWDLIAMLNRRFAERGRMADRRRELCLFIAQVGR